MKDREKCKKKEKKHMNGGASEQRRANVNENLENLR